jgi:hypothetical protein
MKKWAIPLAAAAVIAVVAIAGAAFALNDSGDDAGPGVSRDADDRGESGGDGTGDDVTGICLEGAIDCDDTIDTPADPDVCIQIYPTPPECADPDQPVSDEPPPVDAPAPNLCDANTADCEKAAVALATEDLAGRRGSADGITVKSVEFAQWPDACLGISQPDVACAEVITPGYRILLEASGQKYEYHTDGASRVVLVE